MRSETKVGVVVGLVVVVAASFYIWRSRSGETDLIVSLTPRPGTAVTPIAAPAEPLKTVAVTPTPSPARPATPSPMVAVQPPPREPVGQTPALAVSPTPVPTLGPTPVLGPPLQPPTDLASMIPAESTRPGSDRPGPTQDRQAAQKLALVPTGATPGRSATVEREQPIDKPVPSAATPPALASLAPGSGVAPSGPSLPPVARAQPLPAAPDKAMETPKVTLTAPPAPRLVPTPVQSPADSPRLVTTADTTPGREWPKYHRVERGETLVGLSRRYYGDAGKVDLILAANPEVVDPRSVKVGTRLTMPSPMPAASAGSVISEPRPVSLIARAPTPAPGEPEAAKPSLPVARGASAAPAGRTYTVRSGDTLYSIAEDELGASRRWKELFELNRQLLGGKPDRLRPGMVLTLPAGGPATASGTTPTEPARR